MAAEVASLTSEGALSPAGAHAAQTVDPAAPPLFVIRPTTGLSAVDWAELWNYRDLLYFLTWREISIRYKQTVLGFLWALLQPLLTMIVFTVFLGRVAKVPTDGIPYPVFAYLGLLPWTYFANAVTRSGASLVGNANLLSKVYFPRILIPLSGTLSALVDFAVAFAVLIGLMLYYRMMPSASALLLVPLTAVTAAAAMGVGTWLAALNVRYRDVQHATPFLMQLWMFATPVVYPIALKEPALRFLLAANPMTGVIEADRSAVLGRPIDWHALMLSLVATTAVAIAGFWYFRQMEREFADIV